MTALYQWQIIEMIRISRQVLVAYPLGILLWLTLSFSGVSADDAIQPMQSSSSIPRVDRNLLLGFLADNSTLTLIDARSPEEFGEQHLPGAINLPFDALSTSLELLPKDKLKPIVIYCRSGRRAKLLKNDLIARGYSDVQVLPREQMFWKEELLVFNCSTP